MDYSVSKSQRVWLHFNDTATRGQRRYIELLITVCLASIYQNLTFNILMSNIHMSMYDCILTKHLASFIPPLTSKFKHSDVNGMWVSFFQ